MVVDARGGDDPAQMGDAPRPAHADPVGLAQPVGLHALLRGHRVVAVEHAVAVEQRGGGQHHHVAAACSGQWWIISGLFYAGALKGGYLQGDKGGASYWVVGEES